MRLAPIVAVASCVVFSGCTSSWFEGNSSDAADTEGSSGSVEEPSPIPPEVECTKDSQCGWCGECRDGRCWDYGDCCAALQQEFGFSCSPPDDCYGGNCNDGGDDDVPLWEATDPCESPTSVTRTDLTLASEPLHLVVLDVDHDGTGEIVTVDLDGSLSAWRPDGSLVATLQLPSSALHDLRVLHDHLAVTVQTDTAEYAIARIDVEAEGLSVSLGDPAAGELVVPTAIGDLNGDGRSELAVVTDARLHTWDVDASPAPVVTRDLAFGSPSLALAAVDLDADGRSELLSFDQIVRGTLRVYSVVPTDDEAELVDELAYGGTYHGFVVLDAPDQPERLAIVVQRPIHGVQRTLLPVLEGHPPSLSTPTAFGAPHSHRWAIAVDLDGDGTTEIAVAHDTPEQLLHLYRMHPDGSVDCHTAIEGVGLDQATRGDVDGDGTADLVVRDGLDIQIWSIR
jgi:hypothetical protein